MILILLLSVITVPMLADIKAHSMTVEKCATYTGCCLFVFLHHFTRVRKMNRFMMSVFAAIMIYLFFPALLEHVPPEYLDHFFSFPYTSNLHPGIEKVAHLKIRTFENISIEEAHRVMSTAAEPVHFKGIIKDSLSRGLSITNRLRSSNKDYKMQIFEPKPYDFFRGSRFSTGHMGTIDDVFNSSNWGYISFEPLLLQGEMLDILGFETDESLIIFDSSFVSNFPESIVTTFIHAAPAATSWSVQMMGSKTWFFFDPTLGSRLNSGWFSRVALPSIGDEKMLFEHPSMKVTANAGDIVAFPPQWFHTVVTHPGPNFMLNIRTKVGNWLPSFVPAVRFFAASAIAKLYKSNPNPHYQPGIRHIRMRDLQKIFHEHPEAMRWESVDSHM
jgi:hypothetical protein